MVLVLSLIANPARPAVDPDALDRASAAAGGTVAPPRWLAAGIAAEVRLDRNDAAAAAIESDVRAALAGLPIDVAVLPDENRRKRILVADMDSTIIGQECIDELADMAGIKPAIAAITERAMRGEVAFEPALRERVALLAGLPATVIDDVFRERVRANPGAAILVRTMRAAGAMTVLVSGGFSGFTQKVAAMVGFERQQANELLVADGRLAGTVAEPILGREAKLAALQAVAAELRLTAADVLAVGDGANDLAMIGAAGLGVAYHAKPVVAAAARARIDHGDLTALLYLQGYAQDEFVV